MKPSEFRPKRSTSQEESRIRCIEAAVALYKDGGVQVGPGFIVEVATEFFNFARDNQDGPAGAK